jgi:tetratricopeptide (TPR) repeat protein
MKKALALFALVLAAYADAFVDVKEFHFDDAHAIVDNAGIRSLGNFARFFTDASTFSVLPQNQNWRPVLLVSYAATAQLTGVDPRAFVFVNLLVHFACVILIWQLLRELGRLLERDLERTAWLAAAIFAVHPLFSECIDYVSARSESLSAALTLGALLAYLRGRRLSSLRALAIAGALAALAVATKLVAAIVPLLALGFELAAPRRDPPRAIATRLAWLLIPSSAIALIGARMTPPLARASASSFTRAQWLRSELPALLHYVRLFVWPFGQSADADYPTADSFAEPRVIAAALVLLAAAAFAVLAIRRRPGAALCVGWFLICLAPASLLFPLAEVVNEHRPYLAGAALCVLQARALESAHAWLALPARAWVPLAAGVLIGLGGITAARNRVWHDELTLWHDVAAKAPRSTRAQMNWGLALMSRGRMDEAEAPLREAVRLAPGYAYAQINLGQWLIARGDREALEHFDRALQLAPNLFYAPFYRGLAAEKLGEPAAVAAEYLARATRLSPGYANAWYQLALARQRAGDAAGAIAAAERAVALRGSFDDRFTLAFVLLKAGQAARAQPILFALDRERPGDAKVAINLAAASQMLQSR